MAKVIEFYGRGPVPKKVNPVPIEQRGQLVEFPKEEFAAHSKTEDITERGEVRPSTVVSQLQIDFASRVVGDATKSAAWTNFMFRRV